MAGLPPDIGYASSPLVLDASTYLLGTVAGPGSGVFRTTDGGATWSKVSDLPVVGAPLLRDGKSEVHHEGAARTFMEPVFVPAHDGAAEDEGYVMAYVYDAATDLTDVVILHAQDFSGEPLATIHLPTRVPYGFHGNWVPADR